ncbi:hypothetical protein ACQ4LF_24585, partial [Aeromonas salmonicida]
AVAGWLALDGPRNCIHQGEVGGPAKGRVFRMLVDVNDQVQAGQPLLEIRGKEQFVPVTGGQARLVRAPACPLYTFVAAGDHHA